VGQALLLDGIAQGSRNVILTHYVGESLWAIFSGKNRVTHTLNLKRSAFRANKISVTFFHSVPG
jgi:hypothetical protein